MTAVPSVEWRNVSLGELFRMKHGFAFKGEHFQSSGRYVLLTPGNFRPEGGLQLKGEKEKYYDAAFPEEFLLKRGDLLVVMTDLTQNAPILGSPAFIDRDDRYLHNQRLGKIVDLNGELLDQQYLFYLLNLPLVRDQIKASATGATVKHTAPDRIYTVKVSLPPLPIQRKIADVLSAYDDLIENNTRRIKILEEMAQAIYREWFVKFRFPGHEQAAMVETELGLAPEGWEVTTVGRAFEIIGGGTPSKAVHEYWQNGGVTWYTPTDLTKSGTMFIDSSEAKITQEGLRHSSARLFPASCVMMTSRATIGVVAINTSPACTNQGFITCIPNSQVTAYYLYFWLAEQKEKILGHASGATFKEISKGVFRTFEFLLPPEDLMSKYTGMVDPLLHQVFNLQRKNTNLRRTRDLLLPKLVSGEVDLSGLEVSS